MKILNQEQKNRVKKVLNGGSVSRLKTPEERHQLLLHWNFDDGLKPMEDIASQSDTDLGTIVLLYWLLDPGYVSGLEDNQDRRLKLIKGIEEKVASGFYTNKNISVDPRDHDGQGEQIPQIMLTATPGEPVARVKLNKEYVDKIYPLTDADKEKLNKAIEKGIELLAQVDPGINHSSEPQAIIEAIDSYSKSKRPKENGEKAKFDRKMTNNFSNLDMVFGDQIARNFGWKWFVQELHEEVLDYRDYILVSADKKYYWHPFGGVVKSYSERNYTENLKNYFLVIGNIEEYKTAQMKQHLNWRREADQKYASLSDEELEAVLIQERLRHYRNVPLYAEKYGELSDENFLKAIESQIESDIYGSVLPESVHSLSAYVKKGSFLEQGL